jgi:quinol monooxygenase YgiN
LSFGAGASGGDAVAKVRVAASSPVVRSKEGAVSCASRLSKCSRIIAFSAAAAPHLRHTGPGNALEVGAVSELLGIVRFKFHDGKVEEFKRLSAQCMEIVRAKDTGTLQYDTYFNDDQSECMVLERYRDSEALIEHAEHLGHLMEAILATGSVSGELLGEPSAELRAKLEGSPVGLFTPYLSM